MRKRAFASGKELGHESENVRTRDFTGEEAASKIVSAYDFLERGKVTGKRVFARGKLRGVF